MGYPGERSLEEKVMTDDVAVAGKRVLVTGGTTGIGRAIAVRLARAGAKMFILGREEKDLADALAEIGKAGGEVHGQTADTSQGADIDKVFASVRGKLGGLDILVCNAAIAADGIGDMNDDEWRYAISVNIAGYLACTKAALELMEGQERGDIVLIGSMSAEVREKGSSVYVASKGAIESFAAALRKEVNEKGIRVALIEPGAVSTDMASGSKKQQHEDVEQEKMLIADDIAVCVEFILTQPSRSDVVLMQVRPLRQEI
jgi:NADP-dependent 3-hydroxy acid dehydrogenase YdfG